MNIARLLHQCPTALAVYLHLEELASRSGKNRITTTRKAIVRHLNVRKAGTISTALKILAAEKAISYRARANVNSRGEMRGWYYQISLRTGRYNGTVDNRVSERSGRSNGTMVKRLSERSGRYNGSTLSKESKADASATASAPPLAEKADVHPVNPDEIFGPITTPKGADAHA